MTKQPNNLTLAMSGRFRTEVRRNGIIVDHKEFADDHWHDNKILNSGLNLIGGDGTYPFYACHLGSGNSAPANTQTGLDTWVASTPNYGGSGYSITAVNSGAPLFETKYTFRYDFAQGAVVGNLTEIGTSGFTASSNPLTTRALIVDGSGNPTSLSLVSLDQLTVYYEFTVRPTLTDVTGSFVLATSGGDVTYNFTSRVIYADNYQVYNSVFGPASNMTNLTNSMAFGTDAALGPITGVMTGTQLGSRSSLQVDPYINNSFQRTTRLTWNIGTGNSVSGIKGFIVYPSYQILLNNPIMKDNTRSLTLPFTIGWGRA